MLAWLLSRRTGYRREALRLPLVGLSSRLATPRHHRRRLAVLHTIFDDFHRKQSNQKGTQVNAYRSPLSRLRAALGGSRRSEASSAFLGTGAPASGGSGAPAGGRGLLAFAGVAFAAVIAGVVLLVGSAAPAAASEGCPNEARREEQGAAGRALPDCRAYELVSQPYQPPPAYLKYFAGAPPLEGTFQSTWDKEPHFLPEEQNAEIFARDGNTALFGSPQPNFEGDGLRSNLSRRTPDGWVGENIQPTLTRHSFLCGVTGFSLGSENLEKFIFRIGFQEVGGAGERHYLENCGHDEPRLVAGENEESANLFLRDTASKSWELVDTLHQLPGTEAFDPFFEAISPDGSHVVFSSQSQYTPDAPYAAPADGFAGPPVGYCQLEFGDIYVSSGGQVRLLPILPGGTPARGTLAGAHPFESGCRAKPMQSASFTHSVSHDGERILFYAGGGFKFKPVPPFFGLTIPPDASYVHGGLYLREHPAADQSALSDGGAAGEGDVTAGSNEINSLIAAAGQGVTTEGSNEVTQVAVLTGEFEVGQPISGEGIPAGTTITAKSPTTLTLSTNATQSSTKEKLTSAGAQPFAVGQTITGRGIPAGTTIAAVGPGSLTLSAPATASGTEVPIETSSQCTEPAKACTVRIDVPEGGSGAPGEGQFRWANAETTKIFFTDVERLTPDSTAEAEKPDLYEYDLEKPEGQRLTDLTATAGEPANVLGVAGAAEDGSYLYFAAEANLTGSQQNSQGDTALGPAEGTGTFSGAAKVTGNLQFHSRQVTEVTLISGELRLGQEISGQYIPRETTIAACAPSCSAPTELTLSHEAAEGASGVELTGAGSTEITGVNTASGAFREGMTISANGIPANTWITEVGSGTLTISHGVRANGSQSLSATGANLYMLHGGDTTFIANLSPVGGDVCDWEIMCLTSQVSPNGRFIAFNSLDELTGYDNRPVQARSCGYMHGQLSPSAGLPCPEAYRYSAEAGAGGALTCASCNPTGEPPQSEFGWAVIQQAAKSTQFYDDAMHLNSAVTNNGEVFFETMEGLVPGDENKTWDVYQYDGGEGGSAQLQLISSGKDERPSYFMASTPDGRDVFFVTDQSLLRADTRSDYDLYDARVGGGFAEPLTIHCWEQGAEACRGEGQTAPTLSSPGSANNPNPGNLKPCPKGTVRRHLRCVKGHRSRKRRRHHKHHHRAAHANRRAAK